MQIGRSLAPSNFVYPTSVSTGDTPLYKPGGATLLLSTLPAASGSQVTLADGSIIQPNVQYLRYGQVLTRITAGTVQTITVNATGGTKTITVGGQTTTALAYNASNATTQAALQALSTVGSGRVVVTGTPGTNIILTFADTLGAVALATLNTSAETGGVDTIALTTPALSAGMFGPYDSAATDGRAVLTPGSCYLLDQTYFPLPAGSMSPYQPGLTTDPITTLIEGGLILLERVIQAGAGTHSLAAGPTLAEFQAAFPLFRYVRS